MSLLSNQGGKLILEGETIVGSPIQHEFFVIIISELILNTQACSLI